MPGGTTPKVAMVLRLYSSRISSSTRCDSPPKPSCMWVMTWRAMGRGEHGVSRLRCRYAHKVDASGDSVSRSSAMGSSAPSPESLGRRCILPCTPASGPQSPTEAPCPGPRARCLVGVGGGKGRFSPTLVGPEGGEQTRPCADGAHNYATRLTLPEAVKGGGLIVVCKALDDIDAARVQVAAKVVCPGLRLPPGGGGGLAALVQCSEIGALCDGRLCHGLRARCLRQEGKKRAWREKRQKVGAEGRGGAGETGVAARGRILHTIPPTIETRRHLNHPHRTACRPEGEEGRGMSEGPSEPEVE